MSSWLNKLSKGISDLSRNTALKNTVSSLGQITKNKHINNVGKYLGMLPNNPKSAQGIGQILNLANEVYTDYSNKRHTFLGKLLNTLDKVGTELRSMSLESFNRNRTFEGVGVKPRSNNSFNYDTTVIGKDVLTNNGLGDLQYDSSKIIPIIKDIERKRNERLALQIETLYGSTEKDKQSKVVKILKGANFESVETLASGIALLSNNGKLTVDNIVPLLTGVYHDSKEQLSNQYGIQPSLNQKTAENSSQEVVRVLPNHGTVKAKRKSKPVLEVGYPEAVNEVVGVFSLGAVMSQPENASHYIKESNEVVDFLGKTILDNSKSSYKIYDDLAEDESKNFNSSGKWKKTTIDARTAAKTSSWGKVDYDKYEKGLKSSDVVPQTFKDFFQANLQRMEYGLQHLWDIEITPYNHKGKQPPSFKHKYINILPVTNWALSETATLTDTMEMFGGSSITIPTTEVINKRFDCTMIEDRSFSVKSWLSAYKSYMFNNFKVRPYKDCCCRIRLQLLDYERKAIYIGTYLGYPIDIEMSLEGEDSAGVITRNVSFAIVGEINNVPFHTATERRFPTKATSGANYIQKGEKIVSNKTGNNSQKKETKTKKVKRTKKDKKPKK